MAQTRELARLLSMREPTTVLPVLEAVQDPTDYSRKIKHRAFSPSGRTWLRTGYFETPEVDFATLRKAGRTEPFFRRRANRYQNLCWKNGYVLKTESQEARDYVKSRMEVFALLTGESFDSFMRKVSRELIMFDNCVIWERRVPVKELQKFGITLPLKGIGPNAKKGPVVSYEILPMDTIRYRRDAYGNVNMWQQMSPDGSTRDYDPSEVILIKNDEESGDILAFPVLQMVLPDARVLRQLETDSSLAAHRLAFPIFKYMVGNVSVPETLPHKDADLDGIWYTLEGMLLEGALIIPGHDDFEVVLSDVKMDGLSSVLDYFKKRVIVGLGLSPIHMGEADANRSVTDRLDVQLYDDVKAFQKTLQETFTFFIFSKWLMEGGFNLNYGSNTISEDIVELSFREIDTDSLIKRENHTLAKWVQDLIDHDEARSEIGRTPMTETGKLYSDLIGAINAKYAEQVSKTTAQATAGGQDQGSNAKTKAKKTSAVEEIEDIKSFLQLNNLIKESVATNMGLSEIERAWDKLEVDISSYIMGRHPDNADSFDAKDLTYIQMLFIEELGTSLRQSIVLALRAGIDRGFYEARMVDPDIAPMRMTLFNKNVNSVLRSLKFYLDKLIVDLFDRIEEEVQDSDPPYLGVEVAFMALHYRLDSVIATHIAIAENWGVCMVAKHGEYTRVWQESESGCSVCKSGWCDVDSITLSDVPPFSTHPHCECKMHIKQSE